MAWVAARVSVALLVMAGPAVAGEPDAASVFMVGHSLVNADMPTMLAALADDAGKQHHRGEQIINGAPLRWNWDHSHEAQGLDARVELPTGDWNVLVLTEAIPLLNHLTWSGTYEYAGNFHQLALGGNPGTRTFIYETWHCIDSGSPAGCAYDEESHIGWRERLDRDLPRWQGIADHLNVAYPDTAPVELIPAGQALALLDDRLHAQAGVVPGIGHVFDLFADEIHLADAGNYFVALVMFATIYRQSPQGLTHLINDQWGQPYDLPSADAAAALQTIAWEVVQPRLSLADPVFADGFESTP